MSKQSSMGAEWDALRLAVLERDGHLCQICRVAQATQADHIHPKAKGGEDTLDNLQAACKPCNASKQDRVLTRITYYSTRWFNG